MGEDPIILPIDRVINYDILTRDRVNKDFRLKKFNKRKLLCGTASSRLLIIKRKFKTSSLVIGIIVVSVLVFGLVVPALGVPTRMQDQLKSSNSSETLEEFAEGNQALKLHDDELETIRRSIVEGLGLKRIPDPSKANVSQTEYERAHGEYLRRLQMSRAPGDRRRRRLHTFLATDIETKLDRTKREVSNDETEVTRRIYLPLKMPEDNVEIDHASFRLIVDSDSQKDKVKLSIYRISHTSRHLIGSETFWQFNGPRWIEADITEAAVMWHENQVDNLGLEVHLQSLQGNKIKLKNPVFNVFTSSEVKGTPRQRRSPSDNLMSFHQRGRKTDCHGENKKCCRHEMPVTFKDLKGFEFIVQPKSFDAGYCKGRCPPRYNPAHHHAVLQSLIWKEDRSKAPRPCCAPSKLTELEILYIDDNDPTKLKISSWKNMRVLECACS